MVVGLPFLNVRLGDPNLKNHLKLVLYWVGTHRIYIFILVGGFKYFLFSPLLGEDSRFD